MTRAIGELGSVMARRSMARALAMISVSVLLGACSDATPSAAKKALVAPDPGTHVTSIEQSIVSNPPVVIRQVYGGGGNASTVYTNDFIELFNRSSAPVDLSTWSLQYAAATGTGNFGSSATTLTDFSTAANPVLQPGKSFLVQEGAGGAGTTPLPTADLVDPTPIQMSATAGKVALVSSPTTLGCNGGSTVCGQPALDLIVDLVGYGNANFFEGSAAAPATIATTAVDRAGGGCTDTNQNGADFTAIAPVPRNGALPATPCSASGTDGGSGSDGATGSDGGPSSDGAVGSDGAADAPLGDGGAASDAGGSPGVGACGSAATRINVIQGSAASSTMVGTTVNIEGIVVGDFQDNGINGFFVQEENTDEDGDPATSEGIFVFESALNVPINAGDRVRVRGQVAEFDSLTELTSVTDVVVCSGSATIAPQEVTFPVANVTDLERYEGMSVHIGQPLTVTGNFELGRFGSLDLSVGGRLFQPTNLVAPGAPAIALQSANDRSRIILDDLATAQNPNPIPYKDAQNTRRVGDQLTELSGVLDGRFGIYRIQPTGPLAFTSGNPRPAAPPDVNGRLKVVSTNVLNFFTTLDTGAAVCGPTGGLDCRGANNAAEFQRQREKLLNALQALNPDVAGLLEIENNAQAATASIVDGLNSRVGAGTYAFVNTGTIGTDAIKVAIIYKPAKVSLLGNYALLTTAVDPRFIDTKNRPALAQSFKELGSGAVFTLVLNHLKSKGSACTDVSDPDTGDGQGNCNQTRNNAALALRDWIATDPTHSGDPDFLIAGDLNAYAKEDPITTLKTAGYDALIERFAGASAYSYQFSGQSGYLDHALASATLSAQVAGAAEWHSNADEPVVLDYNTEFKTDDPFTLADPFRSSDHDAVLVGLNLTSAIAPAVPALGDGQRAWLGLFLIGAGAFFFWREERNQRGRGLGPS